MCILNIAYWNSSRVKSFSFIALYDVNIIEKAVDIVYHTVKGRVVLESMVVPWYWHIQSTDDVV